MMAMIQSTLVAASEPIKMSKPLKKQHPWRIKSEIAAKDTPPPAKTIDPPPGFAPLTKMEAPQSPPGLEPSMEAKIDLLARAADSAPVQKASTPGNAMCAILLELVTIASQLAALDKMLDTMQGSAPDKNTEAERWHQVSLEALGWSRDALLEKQKALAQRLAVSEVALPSQVASHVQPDEEPEGRCEPDEEPMLDSIPVNEKLQSTADDDGWHAPCRALPPSAKDCVLGEHSLRKDLEKIKLYPEGSVLIVRKIKQLGFDSGSVLRSHFAQVGEVKEVLVACSVAKPSSKRQHGRVRPAAVGFVVMGSKEEAGLVLAAGGEQAVGESSVVIQVMPFVEKEEPKELSAEL